MEKQPHQEFRDNLAKKLKDAPDKNERDNAFRMEKDGERYELAREQHLNDINEGRIETLRKEIAELLPEEYIKSLKDNLDWLGRDYEEKGINIDRQCQDRFGLSWYEVRKQMFESTSKPIQLLKSPEINQYQYYKDCFTIKPRDLLTGVSTANWMTNEFLEVLGLLYSRGEVYTAGHLKRLAEMCAKKIKENENDSDHRLLRNLEPVFQNLLMHEDVQKLISKHRDVFGEYKPDEYLYLD